MKSINLTKAEINKVFGANKCSCLIADLQNYPLFQRDIANWKRVSRDKNWVNSTIFPDKGGCKDFCCEAVYFVADIDARTMGTKYQKEYLWNEGPANKCGGFVNSN